MKRNKILFFILFTSVFISCIFTSKIFFPSDILHYLPGFHADGFIPPHNSLLADPVFQFEPWRVYAKERILKGELPFWNPSNGNGVPFLANSQVAMFYPLTLLYYVLPLGTALWVLPFLKLFFFGVFLYWYFRQIHITKQIACIVSVTGTFSAFPILWLLWPQTNVFILFPLFLTLIELISRKNQEVYRWYVLLAFAICIGVLGGHPETLFHLLFLGSIYAITRLWKEKQKLIFVFASCLLGFLLSAFQLFPFMEYLVHSNALSARAIPSGTSVLPLQSSIFMIFPYLFGAPQTQLYKPITSYTNFQETASGYVSLLGFIVSLAGIYFLRKKGLVRIWIGIIILCYGISYGIFPFTFINTIPLIKSAANYRLIGFAGVGFLIIFAMSLDRIRTTKYISAKKYFHISLGVFLIADLIVFLTAFVVKKNMYHFSENIQRFFPVLQNHLFFMIFSTLFGMVFIVWIFTLKHAKRLKFLPILLFPLFFQTLFLFWNYNAVTKTSEYYPKEQFIENLQKLPKGTILEVGNLLFPPNLNLVYHLSSVQNDDAIGYAPYEQAFSRAFPQKNQWGRVEEQKLESLHAFNVSYVISDYDINLKKIATQSDHSVLLLPLTENMKFTVPFESKNNSIKEIRFLPATFNRKNTCQVYLTIKIDREILSNNFIDCLKFLDGMYFTVELKKQIPAYASGTITFASSAKKGNALALWGNSQYKPYLELLAKQEEHPYNLLFSDGVVNIWEVPEVKFVTGVENYKALIDLPEEKQIVVSTKKQKDIEIKMTNYPGWQVFIDGKQVKISNMQPFIHVNVPTGTHLIKVLYKPVSFYLGSFLSLLTFFGIMIFVMRKEKGRLSGKERWWDAQVKKIKSKTQWWHHGVVLLLGGFIGFLLFLVFVYSVPMHFTFPQTTAINWYTAHHYPKEQEKFYFIIGTLSVILTGLGVWSVWLWRIIKNK